MALVWGAWAAGVLGGGGEPQVLTLLNVSYDPTREFYEDYNALFVKHWKDKTGQEIRIKQSHGGSGKQARSVLDGLQADVVTLALAYDIDAIAEKSDLIPKDWEKKFPNHATPMTSTIVFLVRKGNPKHIRDWSDLVREDVAVIAPNPKTSGGARWVYLAAYGFALKKYGGREDKAEAFMRALYAHVPVLDTGARGSTTTFAQRGMGDVLLTWENEAFLAINELGETRFERVMPSISILAEPPVAVVEGNAKRMNRGTMAVAQDYLAFLYSDEAQLLAGKHYFRPQDEKAGQAFFKQFPPVTRMTIQDFGGWQAVHKKHFADGGLFDRIMRR